MSGLSNGTTPITNDVPMSADIGIKLINHQPEEINMGNQPEEINMGNQPETAYAGNGVIPKHVSLKAQIDGVGIVVDRIQLLINRINGSDIHEPPKDLSAKASQINPELALSDVLSMAPEQLREHCNRMHDQIQMLEDLLF